jgi:hypothetical protein
VSTSATKSGSQPSTNGGAAGAGGSLVLAGSQSGLALIPQPTPLTRLNYFDGKFLRADDLRVEQDYLRNLAWLGNRAAGSGVIYGLDLTDAGGGKLGLSPGLAIDPQGRVLSLPYAATVDLAQLIAESKKVGGSNGNGNSSSAQDAAGGFVGCALDAVTAPGTGTVVPTDLYLVVAYHAEALCGQEDVYGKLCEDACVTSTDRPYRLEGVLLRALPLPLPAAACTAPWLTRTHRRSQVASAYFADERARLGKEMSGTRLRQDFWCLGATEETGDGVPLAVVSLSANALEWLDEWIARRERMSDPPLRWWQWQTGMRPLAVFWAQVLQFQCQLADVVSTTPTPGGEGDPCARQYTLLQKTQSMLAEVERQYREMVARAGETTKAGAESGRTLRDGYTYRDVLDRTGELEMFRPDFVTRVADLQADVKATLTQIGQNVVTRVLIEHGITELPPAGWLPVAPGPLDVNTQVQRLMGDGVDLRFCAVRPDFVPHAFEEAQHMDRICLLQGLADPNDRPEVDVLVPDGKVQDPEKRDTGIPMETWISVEMLDFDDETLEVRPGDVVILAGASRAERLDSGGGAFHFAAQGEVVRRSRPVNTAQPAATEPPPQSAPTATPAPAAGQPLVLHLAEEPTVEEIARKDLSAMRGGVFGQQTTTTPGKTPGGPNAGGTTVSEYVPSVWATLRTDGDPFALKPGDVTTLRGDVVLSLERKQTMTVGEVHLQGELECLTGGGGQPQLTGRAEGTAIITSPGSPGSARFLTVPVEMALTATTQGGGSFTLKFRGPEEERLTLTAGWGPRPVLATAKVEVDWIETILQRLLADATTEADKETIRQRIESLRKEHPAYEQVQLAAARLRENAGVAQPGNPYHDRAVQGLAALEQLLARPGFRAAAEARLFPAPKVVDEQPKILATRDWVLFHRRRRSSCDCQCHPAPGVAARRYRVYHVRAPFDTTVDEIRRVVTGIKPVDGLQTLGILPEFVEGGATLSTPRAAILDAWKEVHPGNAILYGAVCGAGEGAADPPAVQDARLEAVSSIADDLTPDANAVYEVLSSIPPALPAGGVDGVIVLVTRDAVTTVCHQAYRLVHGTYIHQLEGTDPAKLKDLLATKAHELGTYRFQEGTATAVDDVSKILEKWNAVDASQKPGDAMLLSLAPSGGPLQAGQIAQGGVLLKALKSTGSERPFPRAIAAPVSEGCDVVTVISEAIPIPCQEVWRVDDGMDPAGLPILPQVTEQLQGGHVSEALNIPGVHSLGSVRFYYPTAELLPSQQVPWTDGDAVDQVITASIGVPLADETPALHDQRSHAIAATLKDAATAKYSALGSSTGTLGCSAITLLVHAPKTTCLTVVRVLDLVDTWTKFKDRVAGGDVDGALKLKGVAPFHMTSFTEGSATIPAAEQDILEHIWKNVGGNAQGVLEYFGAWSGAATSQQASMYQAEADAVGGLLAPGTAGSFGQWPASMAAPACPALVAIRVDPVRICQQVWWLDSNSFTALESMVANGLPASALEGQLRPQLLPGLLYDKETGTILSGLEPLKQAWDDLHSGVPTTWRSITGTDGDPDDSEAVTKVIASTLGAASGKRLVSSAPLAAACPGLTVLGRKLQ